MNIPVAIEDARLGAEFTRDLNYFELENPKEYSLYFEGFPIQNNLKVDLKSDASSRIFNGDGYIPVGLQDARLGAEFTRDLNYFELENPKEYSLYFEGFPIQNNLKVDLKSDASSRILKSDRYISQNKLVVISGCSGGGKSTLLSELSNKGYAIVPEVGREIVKEQLAIKGDITPWQNSQAFCEMMIERSIAAYHRAKMITTAMNQVIFFDRSFLEGVSYCQALNINKYNYFVEELRYYPTIFMAPPWRDIFCQDDERKHFFEDAVIEYERLLKFYPQHRYQILELPKTSVEERIEFLLSSIT